LKFKVAVRTPYAAIEGDHERSLREQIGRRDVVGVLFLQRERWRAVASLDGAASLTARSQFSSRALHDGVDLRRRAIGRLAGLEVGLEVGPGSVASSCCAIANLLE
jgi:hypothetical protein